MEKKSIWKTLGWGIGIACIIFLLAFDAWLCFKMGMTVGEMRGMLRADAVISQTIYEVEQSEKNMGSLTWLFGGKDSCDYAKRILLHIQRDIKAQSAENLKNK